MVTEANALPLAAPSMLTTKEAASYLKLSKSSLDKMRMRPGADLEAWVAENLRRSTGMGA